MKGFYHIWAWRPSWSCDPDAANKLSFPLPIKAPHKIWLRSGKRFRRRRCLKLWTTYDDGRTDGRTDGRRTISILLAHLRAFGSGELIMGWSPRCYIPSFVKIGQPVPEKKIFKGFYHIWAWRPSWSCDQHHVIRFLFPCT